MAKTQTLFSQFDDATTLSMPVAKSKSKPKSTSTQYDLFVKPAEEIQTPQNSDIQVPNKFPVATMPYRIAIVGEAPGEDEEKQGEPFVGQSGRYLDQILAKTGIARVACFIGNICQFRPVDNDMKNFDPNGPEIQEGLAQLRKDLTKFQPNIVLLLGKSALYAALGSNKIFNWRGSLFESDRLLEPGTDFLPPKVKCIATFHPAYCLRMYNETPLFMLDVRKCMAEATTKELVLPERNLKTTLSYEELIQELDKIIEIKPTISVDIEGGVYSMSCLSIASSSSYSILVPFSTLDGSSFFAELDQELEVWKRITKIMVDPAIAKVFQNGLYDRFVLQFAYSILTCNAKDDTMLKFWEAYCELEKSLGFQCSVLTKEPFYKFERKADNEQVFFRYCCKDSCVTYEINEKLDKILDVGGKQHYEFNNLLLYPLLYMELRGLKYNEDEAKRRHLEMMGHVYRWQDKLDQLAIAAGAIDGIDFTKTNLEILDQVQSICCYVRDRTQPKADAIKRGYSAVASRLLNPISLSNEERGKISMLCKATMNTKSKKFKDFLYRACKLPIQYKKDLKTKELKETTDYLALLKLFKQVDHPTLSIALELSRLRTRAQFLAIQPYQGRMHCSLNLVGSETGRITSSKANLRENSKQVGANMQTVSDDWDIDIDWDIEGEEHPLTHGMRDLMLADPGCYLAKCDLKGADGWTVGAYMAWLGDSTMLDDLKFGIKPAQVVAYILKHGAANIIGKDRHELKEILKEIKKDDWEYFVSKQGIWGTCYTMGPRKLSEIVFIQSEGKVNLTEKAAKEFQACIQVRYRVSLWHKWMQRHLEAQTYPAKLVAPNGQTRKFFGRKTDILGEALAHIPQVVTTYATNQAAKRLWTDPENRVKLTSTSCRLRVEPMHQVHDELLVQFKVEDTDWAIGKIKSWFNNPITIANQTLVIPFDGAYGTNWSMGEGAKVGDIK